MINYDEFLSNIIKSSVTKLPVNIWNTLLELELNELIIEENMFLTTIVKEYQILRIIGGNASLSWL